MSGDRSLDEFATGAETAESEARDEGEADVEEGGTDADAAADPVSEAGESDEADVADGEEDAEAKTEHLDADAVDPATPTMRHDPAGVACGACGETVERRWEEDDAFVCADCKAW
ncbi:hypothetical protein ACFO0N_10255 [Halobium salinum]|uniref:DUF7573 domain-containing protein n=1 Tax=Halobium salinum TaxID=1364940 RepID=A0ABD5PBP8_9EURY|nr:hypothetical protein [Halobium salinum]